MEFSALADEVERLEAELDSAVGGERLGPLLALAWQLRQRNTRRAVALADEAQGMLDSLDSLDAQDSHAQDSQAQNSPAQGSQDSQCTHNGLDARCSPCLSAFERRQALARLMLVRGEAAFLFSEFAKAEGLAGAALQEFADLADHEGCADAYSLRGMLAHANGDPARRLAELETMEAVSSGDPARAAVAQAQLAQGAAFRDVAAARQRWGARFAAGNTDLHPSAGCFAQYFLAVCANQVGDFAGAVRHHIESHMLALACGQTRTAILAATNVGDALNSLNEHQSALEWMQRGLELARAQGWPSLLGIALQQTAHTLRHLRDPEAVRAMLREALVLLAPQAASRHYGYTLLYLGDAELDCKEHGSALATFQRLTERADALCEPRLQSQARRGESQALLGLGQASVALAAAEAALSLAQGNPANQIDALRALAEIHAACVHAVPPLPVPPDMRAANAPLHFLQQALALTDGISGHTVPVGLLEALADASESIGQHREACAYLRQAIAAREKTHSLEARNRASALQATHEAERARAESEHLRKLAQAESQRAEALRQSGAALERLNSAMQERLDSLTTLTAGVAHEISNPVNFSHVAAQNQRADIAEFRQFVDSMLEADDDPDVVHALNQRFDRLSRNIDIFLNGTGRVRGIVQDLNAYTRQDKLPSERARVSECMLSTLAMVRVGWEDRIGFSTELEPDPEIECWPSLLNQVFMNLMVNGCHAIVVRHGEFSKERGCLSLRLAVRDGMLSASVADNGVGMDEAVRARVVEPFFTTKRQGEGTGLGLSIVHGIVQRHGGELRIESVEGEGSCFTLLLPLARLR